LAATADLDSRIFGDVDLSQSAGRSPVLLAGFVVAFTLILGGAAWGLNQVVNPPPPQTPCPTAPAPHPVANARHSYTNPPSNALQAGKEYVATMCTSKGIIKIALRGGVAPQTVNAFIFLADSGYYDGLTFHRVCPSSSDPSCGGATSQLHIAQGGDPNGDGTGRGPGFPIPDETPDGGYTIGTVALARPANQDGSKIPNSSGGQFFIDTGTNNFSPDYNLFGDVISGLTVAQHLVKGDTIFWIATETVTAPEPSASPSASPSPSASAAPSPSPSGVAPSPSPS
jgi:cyclophilin family peptidyl-prolyl cis-trans isomerase